MSGEELSSLYGIPNIGIKHVEKKIEEKKSTGVVSMAGTEVVQLKTTMFDLMYCSSVKGHSTLYGIVLHNPNPKYNSVTAGGLPFVKLDQMVYTILLETLRKADARIKDQAKDISTLTNERDLYKSVVDTLKANGIID